MGLSEEGQCMESISDAGMDEAMDSKPWERHEAIQTLHESQEIRLDAEITSTYAPQTEGHERA